MQGSTAVEKVLEDLAFEDLESRESTVPLWIGAPTEDDLLRHDTTDASRGRASVLPAFFGGAAPAERTRHPDVLIRAAEPLPAYLRGRAAALAERIEDHLGTVLHDWTLSFEPAGRGTWARLSARWNGVRLHVDQEAPDMDAVLERAFESLGNLLEVPSAQVDPV
jgi:hypothetical protein